MRLSGLGSRFNAILLSSKYVDEKVVGIYSAYGHKHQPSKNQKIVMNSHYVCACDNVMC